MNSLFSQAAPRLGTTLALAGLAALATVPAGAQVTQTFTTYGNSFAVSQTDYAVAGTYSGGDVTTASKTDDLERLYNPAGPTGPATITFDASSPIMTADANNPLHNLVDASQGNGGGGFTLFNGDGGNTTGTPAAIAAFKLTHETVIDFTFNDPLAPNGETLTGLGLTTIGTGDGRQYYDVDFAYSTDGVTFTKFLTAQDSNAAFATTGSTDEFLQASGISIADVKVLQLTERPNTDGPANPYYQVGSAVGEVDAFFTPSPAAVPEASTTVSFGLLLMLGLGGLVVVARRKAAQASA